MNEELRHKKNMLIRKNESKLLLHNYMQKISDLLNISSSDFFFLTLEESDSIRKTYFKNEEDIIRYEISSIEIKSVLLDLFGSNNDAWYVFIDDDWEYCGGIQIDNLQYLNAKFKFGKLITDDIVFINTDLKTKVVFDCFEMNNQYFVECEIFYNI